MTGRDVEPKSNPSEVSPMRTGQYGGTSEWTAKGQVVALCHGAVPQGGRGLDEGEKSATVWLGRREKKNDEARETW